MFDEKHWDVKNMDVIEIPRNEFR